MLEKTPNTVLTQHIEQLCELFQVGQIEKVIRDVGPLIKEFPNSIALLNIKGISYSHLNRFDEAIKTYKEAIQIEPENSITYFNLGVTLQDSGRLNEALEHYKIALNKNPQYLDAIINIGSIFQKKGNSLSAISYFEKAIQIEPENSITYFNLGVTLQDSGRLNEALEHYKIALNKNPQYLDAIINIGSIFQKKGNSLSAISYFEKALALNPNHVPTLIQLGIVQRQIGKLQAATNTFKKACEFDFSKSVSKANLGYVLCDKGNIHAGLNEIETAVNMNLNNLIGQNNLLFHCNYSPDLSAEEVYNYYKRFDDHFSKKFNHKCFPHKISRGKRKLKIGYVSSDLSRTSLSRFVEPIFINHDKEKFEVYAFARIIEHDYMTSSIKSHCDGWINTNNLSPEDLAQKIYDLGIDILIDLAGHTRGNRLEMFMHKPAPVSLSWWIGFGYTTGLSNIDYFLADPTLVPEGSEHLFTEKVWKMDYPCSAVFRPDPTMGSVNPLPALTNGYVTFGSLTRAIRLNDRVIKTWTNILKKVPYSKLIINSGNFEHDEVKDIYIEKFKQNGIPQDRLDIGYSSPPWNILKKIDIGLDCFPHNSGTTLVEHLYMGNPYITLADRPSVGRIGSHYLHGIGHSEWIAHSEEEYVEKACALSSDLQALSRIRVQLRSDMEASPLRNEKAFVKKLEYNYQQMWENYLINAE